MSLMVPAFNCDGSSPSRALTVASAVSDPSLSCEAAARALRMTQYHAYTRPSSSVHLCASSPPFPTTTKLPGDGLLALGLLTPEEVAESLDSVLQARARIDVAVRVARSLSGEHRVDVDVDVHEVALDSAAESLIHLINLMVGHGRPAVRQGLLRAAVRLASEGSGDSTDGVVEQAGGSASEGGGCPVREERVSQAGLGGALLGGTDPDGLRHGDSQSSRPEVEDPIASVSIPPPASSSSSSSSSHGFRSTPASFSAASTQDPESVQRQNPEQGRPRRRREAAGMGLVVPPRQAEGSASLARLLGRPFGPAPRARAATRRGPTASPDVEGCYADELDGQQRPRKRCRGARDTGGDDD